MRLEGKAGQSRFLLILCHVMLYAVVMVPSFTYRNITTSIYKRKVETLLRRGLSLLFFLIHTCLLCMYKMHKHIKHKYTNLYILEKKKGRNPQVRQDTTPSMAGFIVELERVPYPQFGLARLQPGTCTTM